MPAMLERKLPDGLPPRAAAKISTLIAAVDEAEALSTVAQRNGDRLRQEIALLANQLDALPERGQLERRELLERQIAALKGEADATQAAWRSRSTQSANGRQTLAQVRHWLTKVSSELVIEDVPNLPSPPTGDLSAAVSQLRDQVEDIKAQIREIRAAPLPLEDLKAKATALVERLANAAHPRLQAANGELELRFAAHGVAIAETAEPNRDGRLLKIMAWLYPEMIERRMHALLDAKVADETADAISEEEKASRISTLKDLLLKLEREEEAAIVAAAATGHLIPRRQRCNPLAVLGVITRHKSKASPKREAA